MCFFLFFISFNSDWLFYLIPIPCFRSRTISTCSVDGGGIKVILQGDLQHPKAIAVHPALKWVHQGFFYKDATFQGFFLIRFSSKFMFFISCFLYKNIGKCNRSGFSSVISGLWAPLSGISAYTYSFWISAKSIIFVPFSVEKHTPKTSK